MNCWIFSLYGPPALTPPIVLYLAGSGESRSTPDFPGHFLRPSSRRAPLWLFLRVSPSSFFLVFVRNENFCSSGFFFVRGRFLPRLKLDVSAVIPSLFPFC